MSSVKLHPTLGLNPKILQHQCPACAVMSDGAIVLLGIANYRVQCPDCNAWVYGGVRRGRPCPRCDSICNGGWAREELSEYDRFIPGAPRLCKECEGHAKLGVIFVCVSDDSAGGKDKQLMGMLCVLKDEAVERCIADDALRQHILRARMAYVPYSDWKQMGLPMPQGSEDVTDAEEPEGELKESTTPA